MKEQVTSWEVMELKKARGKQKLIYKGALVKDMQD